MPNLKLTQPVRIKEPQPPPCYICGGSGLVLRAYVEPNLGLKQGKEKVRCPKCTK